MKKFSSLVNIFLVVTMLITLPGCNLLGGGGEKTGPKKKVSLKIWQLFDSPEVMQPIIDEYTQDRAEQWDVTIEYQQKDFNEYVETTTNALAAGQGPDIWMIRNDWVPRESDKLQPMPDTLMSEETYRGLFPDVVANDNIIDGKIYGLPWSVDTLALYYNPAIFAQVRNELDDSKALAQGDNILESAPANWEELIRAVKYLTVKNDNNIQRAGIALGTSNNVANATDILTLLMLQNQTKMLSDEKTTAVFNEPIQKQTGEPVYSGTKALEFYKSFSDPGKDVYTWNKDMPDSVQSFINGQTAMMIHYSFVQKTLFDKAPTFRYNVAPMPQIKDAPNATDYANYWVETVTNNCQNSDVAWDFINFVRDKRLNDYLNATKRPSPYRVEAQDVPIVQQRADDTGATFRFQVNTAQDWYKGKFPVKVDNVFKEMIDNVTVGNLSPQSAINIAADKTTTLLQKEPY